MLNGYNLQQPPGKSLQPSQKQTIRFRKPNSYLQQPEQAVDSGPEVNEVRGRGKGRSFIHRCVKAVKPSGVFPAQSRELSTEPVEAASMGQGQ
jgi:hypothetical protein